MPSIASLLDDSSFANSQPPPSSVYNNNNKSNNINASNNLNTLSASTSMPKASGAMIQQQQQQQQQPQNAVDDVSVDKVGVKMCLVFEMRDIGILLKNIEFLRISLKTSWRIQNLPLPYPETPINDFLISNT